MFPTDRKYTKEHEWIRVDGETATLGITDFAQRELGDIVFVELPEKGKQVTREEVLGTIESVKAVAEVFSPVTGIVLEVNADLDGSPETLNQDPHDKGWYCKLQLSDPSELDGLMDAAAYEKFTES